MEANQNEILLEVFFDVIEKLAFMFGEPTQKEEIPSPESDCIMASIVYTGKTSGVIDLLVPEVMCAELAANILGMEQADQDAIARGTDSLKELLNVTCGNFLTTLAGDTPVFNVSAPTAKQVRTGEWSAFLENPDFFAAMIDEHPALLRISNDK